MSAITTHVLDTASGCAAAGVLVTLERSKGSGWTPLGAGLTDNNGRIQNLLAPDAPFEVGTYRLTFATGAYFRIGGIESFYPEVRVVFDVRDPHEHYHVPLLVSPFGYTTYRGT